MGDTQRQRRERQERIARAALPRLNDLADELESLANEVFAQRIPYQPDWGADVMALSFMTKQREHLRSVRTLISADLSRDALLITRTMIEGLGRLLWAFNKIPERTELWLWFGAILDWRQILKNEAAGMVVDADEKAELMNYVDTHGHHYFRPKVRKALEAAEKDGAVYEIPDDPWGNNWTDVKVETMLDEVGGRYLYDSVYRNSSEWIHWGPRAILRATEPGEWDVHKFTEQDWRAAETALRLGCQSLLQSLELLDHQFSLRITERLAELVEKMATVIDESLEAGH